MNTQKKQEWVDGKSIQSQKKAPGTGGNSVHNQGKQAWTPNKPASSKKERSWDDDDRIVETVLHIGRLIGSAILVTAVLVLAIVSRWH